MSTLARGQQEIRKNQALQGQWERYLDERVRRYLTDLASRVRRNKSFKLDFRASSDNISAALLSELAAEERRIASRREELAGREVFDQHHLQTIEAARERLAMFISNLVHPFVLGSLAKDVRLLINVGEVPPPKADGLAYCASLNCDKGLLQQHYVWRKEDNLTPSSPDEFLGMSIVCFPGPFDLNRMNEDPDTLKKAMSLGHGDQALYRWTRDVLAAFETHKDEMHQADLRGEEVKQVEKQAQLVLLMLRMEEIMDIKELRWAETTGVDPVGALFETEGAEIPPMEGEVNRLIQGLGAIKTGAASSALGEAINVYKERVASFMNQRAAEESLSGPNAKAVQVATSKSRRARASVTNRINSTRTFEAAATEASKTKEMQARQMSPTRDANKHYSQMGDEKPGVVPGDS